MDRSRKFKKINLKLYTWILCSFWTAVILTFCFIIVHHTHKNTEVFALNEARAYFSREQVFRLWGSSHGGVYVPISETTPPNTHLSHLADRDVETISGRKLTLMNPANMMRQIYENFPNDYGARGHLTSTKPLRPDNRPDEWERKALLELEKGTSEIREVIGVNGEKHLRVMRPMVAQAPCLKCHGQQGYKEGDIRGGVSISVPLNQFYELEQQDLIAHLTPLGILWLLGLAGIYGGSCGLEKRIKERDLAQAELQNYQDKLEKMVEDRTTKLRTTNESLEREITARERAEENIKNSHLELEQIFNTAAGAMRVVDKEFNILRVNKTFQQLVGLSAEELIGKKCYEVFSGPVCDTPECPFRQVLEGRENIETEVEKEKLNGDKVWCILNVNPFRDQNGELVGFIEDFRDITERKQTELTLQKAYKETSALAKEVKRKHQELKKAHAKLKASQSQLLQREKMASIGQLAAGVAHEINNPIGFISSNLGTLSKYVDRFSEFADKVINAYASESCSVTELKELRTKLKIDFIAQDAKDLVNESLDGTDRVSKIVQGLKSFSRVDEAEHKLADINECLESTINIVWNELKYKATVNKDYGALPLTKCYPQQLNQVFMNLLVNASHAIEKQGEIRLKTWQEEESIFVTVSDTGTGIPTENANRLFEPFFTTKDVGKGTGLGLSISYDIIKKHEGEIWVDSEEGKGSTFTIKLPIING